MLTGTGQKEAVPPSQRWPVTQVHHARGEPVLSRGRVGGIHRRSLIAQLTKEPSSMLIEVLDSRGG